MKYLFALIFLLIGTIVAPAQNEQSPLVEKEIAYRIGSIKMFGPATN